ncbi:hypothetical protein GCM10022281_04720 [Sphingomonas rosea]|uniref:Uncharacterized protein n=1 Tax=Sphingomonas rosea TaxID=335605 RepID=A0ABP7TN35_9SPHN
MRLLLAASALLTGTVVLPLTASLAKPSTGVAQPTKADTCLAMERASRNSTGGDRAAGQFGKDQREFVALFNDPDGFTPNWPIVGKTYYSYGEWLNDSKLYGC